MVFHGFYGRPVKLISALFKSAFVSFLPMMCTIIISIPNLVTLFNLVHLGQNLFMVVRRVEDIEVDILYIVLLLGCVNLHLELNLVFPIIVVESSGLVQSIRKSGSLMKGKKMLALKMLIVYGTFALILGIFSSWILEVQLSLTGDLTHGGWWKMVDWEFVIRILLGSVFFMLVLLFNTLSNIVLYVYCINAQGNEEEKLAK